MIFEQINHAGNIFALRYEGEENNELTKVFKLWYDPLYLTKFFNDHIDLLRDFFKVTVVKDAVNKTIQDAFTLSEVILDATIDIDMNLFFRPLNDMAGSENNMEKEKLNPKKVGLVKSTSWLRLYAVKVSDETFIITGGAIKLVNKMKDQPETSLEILKMDSVLNFLRQNNVFDESSFHDFLNE